MNAILSAIISDQNKRLEQKDTEITTMQIRLNAAYRDGKSAYGAYRAELNKVEHQAEEIEQKDAEIKRLQGVEDAINDFIDTHPKSKSISMLCWLESVTGLKRRNNHEI